LSQIEDHRQTIKGLQKTIQKLDNDDKILNQKFKVLLHRKINLKIIVENENK